MAWCHQATSHYQSKCWPRSLSPYDATRPQWVNLNACWESASGEITHLLRVKHVINYACNWPCHHWCISCSTIVTHQWRINVFNWMSKIQLFFQLLLEVIYEYDFSSHGSLWISYDFEMMTSWHEKIFCQNYWAFVWDIHQPLVHSPHKGTVWQSFDFFSKLGWMRHKTNSICTFQQLIYINIQWYLKLLKFGKVDEIKISNNWPIMYKVEMELTYLRLMLHICITESDQH